jgi:hypothetical protein
MLYSMRALIITGLVTPASFRNASAAASASQITFRTTRTDVRRGYDGRGPDAVPLFRHIHTPIFKTGVTLRAVRSVHVIQKRHQMRKLACYMAATLAICGAAVAVDSGNTAEIDRVEAETLSQVQKGRLDPSQRIILLGKAIFFDQNLSVRRNESCALCHTGESIARRTLWLARTYRGDYDLAASEQPGIDRVCSRPEDGEGQEYCQPEDQSKPGVEPARGADW